MRRAIPRDRVGALPTTRELRRAALFAALDETTVATLVKSARPRVLSRGEVLFCEGDDATRYYFVRAGQLKLFVTTASGREKVLEIATPGSTFAEAAIFMGHATYPAHAEAITDALVVAFDGDELVRVLGASTELCLRLLGHLSMRLRLRVREIHALSCQDVRARVAAYLCGLVDAERGPRSTVHLGAPRHVVASKLSLRPETLSRVLAHLASEGVIALRGARVEIVDYAELGRIAGEAPRP